MERISEKSLAGNPQLHIHQGERTPSWKRYGKGVANAEFTFYSRAGKVGVSVEETYFADSAMDEKRDVTRGAMMELSREAAARLHSALGEFLKESI
jgi:hypothetical protein